MRGALKRAIAKPFPSQDALWTKPARERYQKILDEADEMVTVNPDPYAAWKMQRRNEWMVDRADAVIAIWDGQPSGTANCVEYALRRHKPVFHIDQIRQTETRLKQPLGGP